MWLEIHESEEVDRITVHGRDARKDRGWVGLMTALWLLVTAAALVFAVLMVRHASPTIGALLALFAFLAVILPVGLAHLRGRTYISIWPNRVAVQTASLPLRNWQCSRDNLQRVSFEFWETVGDSESVPTVNLVRRGGNPLTRRCTLGNGLHVEHRRELYQALAGILAKRGFDCEMRCQAEA